MKTLLAFLLATYIFHVSKFDENLELLWVRQVRVHNCRDVDHAWKAIIHHYPLEKHSIQLDQKHWGK